MTPKNASDLYKEFSEDLEISESLVENLIEFFYKEVKDQLTNLRNPRINVIGLGQFVAKSITVQKHIEKFTNVVKNCDTYSFSGYYNKKNLEEKLELLTKLDLLLEIERQRKQQFLIDNGKINGDMEK